VFYDTTAGFVSTGAVATFNTWHHFRVVLDYSSENYQAFFDNTHLITAPFVDLGQGVNAFTDADIAATVAGNDPISAALTGTAFFDNFVVREDVRLPGDFDLNGIVNAADYTLWKQTFGNTVALGDAADGNGNGKIDAADYTVWRDHLGASLIGGAGSGSLSNSAVPEPNALVLAFSGLVTATCRRAWRKRRGQ
jgi:hypothetical protein